MTPRCSERALPSQFARRRLSSRGATARSLALRETRPSGYPAPDAPNSATAASRVLVFDSRFGGLTVFSHVAAARTDADPVCVADDVLISYNGLSEGALVGRVVAPAEDVDKMASTRADRKAIKSAAMNMQRLLVQMNG